MITQHEDVEEAFNKACDIFDDMQISHIWQTLAQVLIVTDIEINIKLYNNDKSFDEFLKYLKNFREVARKEWEKTNDN